MYLVSEQGAGNDWFSLRLWPVDKVWTGPYYQERCNPYYRERDSRTIGNADSLHLHESKSGFRPL